MKAAIAAAVLALAAAPAMAKPHAGRPSDILVSGGQIRASLGGSPNSAAYMTIANAGPKPDRLVSITCACAGKAEAHLSRMDHGVMTMAPAGPVVIPAHGRVVFKPSGLHVMLLGVKGRLMDGRNQPMMLRFERAGVVTATFQVRAQILDAGPPAAHPMDNMHGMPGM